MRSFIVVLLVISFLFTATFAVAQTSVTSEFLQIRETLNGEAERIDLLEVGLERDLGRLRTSLGGLQREQSALRAEVEGRMSEIEQQLAELPELRQGLSDLTAAVDRGNLRIEQIEGMAERFGARLDALEGRVADLELRVDDAVYRIEQLEAQVEVNTVAIGNLEQRGPSLHVGGLVHGGHQTLYGASAAIGFSPRGTEWRTEIGATLGTNTGTFVHGEFIRLLSPNLGDTGLSVGPELRTVVDEGPLGNGNSRVGVYVGPMLRWGFGPSRAVALDGFVGVGPGFAAAAPDTRLDRAVGFVAGGGVGLSLDVFALFK